MTTPPSLRTTVCRAPKQACYAPETIYAIIDEALFCHIAFSDTSGTHCIPMNCWRVDDKLCIHGANNSRLINALLQNECCVAITLLDGLVLARSAFHHAVNYRSVVVYGRFSEIEDKARCLERFLAKLSPERKDKVRPPNEAELAGTQVLALSLKEASAKIRKGGVKDDPKDRHVPVWAGVIPLSLQRGEPEADVSFALAQEK